MDEEAAYLGRYPDVARAVRTGEVASALDHYLRYGRSEGRRWPTDGTPRAVTVPAPAIAARTGGRSGIFLAGEVACIAPGYIFIHGWVDDRADSVVAIEIVVGEEVVRRDAVRRYRREDVETSLAASAPFEAGFWSLAETPNIVWDRPLRFRLCLASDATAEFAPAKLSRLGMDGLLDAFFAFFAERSVLGSAIARSFVELESGLAAVIRRAHLARREGYALHSEGSYGSTRRPALSLVCCLYGVPDFLFLQVAMFARTGSVAGLEFIFVNNSPGLEATLHRDAEIAAELFGACVRIFSLNQNTGFSYANNFGIARASANTVVVINPDVYPMSRASVAALRALRSGRRVPCVTGAKLFYADGSVMHEGMDCCADTPLSAQARMAVGTVEHRRKGFPERAGEGRKVVPAVSGALMVARHEQWRALGGFDEDFVYGHYEDTDLCFRVRKLGGAVFYDPRLRFWHFEGMGAVHRPEHAGAAVYNRWLFSKRWGSELALGPGETAP